MFRLRLVSLAPVAALVLLVAASGCAPGNRLREVSVEGRRVAVAAAIPPHPRVQAGSPAEAGIDPYDPIGSVIRVGTAVDKRRRARGAQARLDSAVARIDVADRIARRVLAESANRLHFRPAPRPDAADFVLDLRVADYALVADSFEGSVSFVLAGDLVLRVAATGEPLWRTELAERRVLDRSFFFLPAAVGNVVTGRALSNLSPDEMEAGLARLADRTAEQIVDRFVADYARSRRAYEKRQREGR